VDLWRAYYENIFWSIDGELHVRASFESIFDVDIFSMIEDLFGEREHEKDIMDASKFRQHRIS
jgi:hypothetical protein